MKVNICLHLNVKNNENNLFLSFLVLQLSFVCVFFCTIFSLQSFVLKLISNSLAVGNPAAFHFILLALTLMFYNKNGVFQTHPDILGGIAT